MKMSSGISVFFDLPLSGFVVELSTFLGKAFPLTVVAGAGVFVLTFTGLTAGLIEGVTIFAGFLPA